MDDERRESIGATIRTLREARGLSRRELAETAKISLEMLAKIEQGRKAPSAATLARLAGGLGIDAPDLANRADAWQAMAAAGASQAALRSRTITGALGLGAGLGAAVPFAGVAAGLGVGVGLALQKERRNRRVIEALLRSNLREDLDLSDEDLMDIAVQLGVQAPLESLDALQTLDSDPAANVEASH